jgi:N-acetylmuramoyl-L-alanine amidase
MAMNGEKKPAVFLILYFLSLSLSIFSLPLDKAGDLYRSAEKDYQALMRSKGRLSKANEWLNVINSYREVVVLYSDHPFADDAMFKIATLYQGMYEKFKDTSSLNEAVISYRFLSKRYPKSPYLESALFTTAQIYFSELKDLEQALYYYQQVVDKFPRGEKAKYARIRISYLEKILAERKRDAAGLVWVENIRHWTGEDYTRVVIDVADEISYDYHKLVNPDRIYFDLKEAKLTPELAGKVFPIKGEFLNRVRVGQYRPDVVRVVLDLGKVKSYTVFSLYNPDRIVIDVKGGEEIKIAARTPKANKKGRYSLARQLGLTVNCIVIDPGHGGKDPGAIGRSGLTEKFVTLDVAKRLADLIRKNLGCKVILTREDDRHIPLEERTAIANSKKADIFLSIHTNANRDKNTSGIETYFLNFASDPQAEATAARENAISEKNLARLQGLVNKITLNTKIDESKELAESLQKTTVSHIGRYYRVRNLGVKQAPFYVLIGANMPSILTELGFISHPMEEKRLRSATYRQRLAYALYLGIKEYIESLS